MWIHSTPLENKEFERKQVEKTKSNTTQNLSKSRLQNGTKTKKILPRPSRPLFYIRFVAVVFRSGKKY